MYLTSTLRRALIIGGIAILAVVGLIGWTTHRPALPVAASTPALGYGAPAAYPEPVAANPEPYAPANAYGEPTYGNVYNSGSPVYAPSPFAADGSYGYGAGYAAPMPPPPPPDTAVVTTPPPPERVVVERQYVYRGGRRYVVVHRRHHNKWHKVEVIAGTAGAGALIGGIAGGGKGAGIGALAGGAGGYLYEKLHH